LLGFLLTDQGCEGIANQLHALQQVVALLAQHMVVMGQAGHQIATLAWHGYSF
jgi:hypothetical protein